MERDGDNYREKKMGREWVWECDWVSEKVRVGWEWEWGWVSAKENTYQCGSNERANGRLFLTSRDMFSCEKNVCLILIQIQIMVSIALNQEGEVMLICHTRKWTRTMLQNNWKTKIMSNQTCIGRKRNCTFMEWYQLGFLEASSIIQHFDKSGRKWIRFKNHNQHPIFRPHGRYTGCPLWRLCRNLTAS